MGKRILIIEPEEKRKNSNNKIPLIRDDPNKEKITKCIVCLGVIKPTLPTVECSCGKKFHDSCAGRVDKCPVCNTNLKLSTIGKLIRRGVILRKKGLYEESIAQYDKALKASKVEDETIWFNKGYSLAQMREFSKAITCYEKAISIEPEYYRAYNNLGVIHSKVGNYQEALKAYGKAKNTKEKGVKLFFNLGLYYIKNHQIDKSIKYFMMAIRKDEDHFKSHAYLAKCYRIRKEMIKSRDHIKKALIINDRYYYSHFIDGTIKYQDRMYEMAKTAFHNSISKKPTHYKSYVGYINCCMKLNNKEDAERMAKDLRKIAGGDQKIFMKIDHHSWK